MDKEKKKVLRRKLAWFFLRAFTAICGGLSLKASYNIGKAAANIAYLFAVRHRRIAIDSLSIAFPHRNKLELKRTARKSFVFMAQSSLETLNFLKNPRYIEKIRIEGRKFLDEALEQKKGVIALSAHLGNFPLISLKLAELGYPAWVMARPMRDEQTGNYLHKLRTEAGVKTILSYPRRESVNQTIRVLRDNGIVMIQMDQNFGTGGVWVKFFDRLAATPVGPIVFALRTKAVVLPIYIQREGIGKHVIRIMPPLEIDERDSKEETILVNAVKFTAVIEGWIKESPYEWGWIHRRWKSTPSDRVMKMEFKVQKD
ncbi:MAG: hypothetical protein B1H08_01400 [Candidatus Omnitrophica bacterium 4484_171]|nr:MAG: hypothetical protein B1H08_01400 [Candidatus Omnitrophica bacterium 4484_171]